MLHLPLQIQDLHGEEALKKIKKGTMVRKLSLSIGSACAVTFPAAVLLPCAAVAKPLGLQFVNDRARCDLMGSPAPALRSVVLSTPAFTTALPPVPTAGN